MRLEKWLKIKWSKIDKHKRALTLKYNNETINATKNKKREHSSPETSFKRQKTGIWSSRNDCLAWIIDLSLEIKYYLYILQFSQIRHWKIDNVHFQ